MGRINTVNRITADVRTRINALVTLIGPFLPLNHPNKHAVTFTTIFRESNVDEFLIGPTKSQALQHGFENIFRYHPRLPYTLIRKIVPAGIEYRKFKRDPITRKEIQELGDHLEILGIKIKGELARIEIDETLPIIQVPPEELIKRLSFHPLVKEIESEPLDLFKNGHFNESVRRSAERFETSVQHLTGLNDIGKSLMGKAFSGLKPLLPLNKLKTENEKAFQEGYQLLAMGLMGGIRNIFSHGDENERSPEECYEMLLLINWMFRHLPT